MASNVLTCTEFGLSCEYMRERKKRGKASRKDLAKQAASRMTSDARSPNDQSSDETSPTQSRHENTSSNDSSSNRPVPESQRLRFRSLSLGDSALSDSQTVAPNLALPPRSSLRVGSSSILREDGQLYPPHMSSQPNHSSDLDHPDGQARLHLPGFESIPGYSLADHHRQHISDDSKSRPFCPPNIDISGYGDIAYPLQSPSTYQANTPGVFRLGSPLTGYPNNGSPSEAPEWLAMPSPGHQYQQQIPPSFSLGLRYPVLQPLLPHLGSILPQALTCDLLDLYFSSSSSAYMHPLSP